MKTEMTRTQFGYEFRFESTHFAEAYAAALRRFSQTVKIPFEQEGWPPQSEMRAGDPVFARHGEEVERFVENWRVYQMGKYIRVFFPVGADNLGLAARKSIEVHLNVLWLSIHFSHGAFPQVREEEMLRWIHPQLTKGIELTNRLEEEAKLLQRLAGFRGIYMIEMRQPIRYVYLPTDVRSHDEVAPVKDLQSLFFYRGVEWLRLRKAGEGEPVLLEHLPTEGEDFSVAEWEVTIAEPTFEGLLAEVSPAGDYVFTTGAGSDPLQGIILSLGWEKVTASEWRSYEIL